MEARFEVPFPPPSTLYVRRVLYCSQSSSTPGTEQYCSDRAILFGVCVCTVLSVSWYPAAYCPLSAPAFVASYCPLHVPLSRALYCQVCVSSYQPTPFLSRPHPIPPHPTPPFQVGWPTWLRGHVRASTTHTHSRTDNGPKVGVSGAEKRARWDQMRASAVLGSRVEKERSAILSEAGAVRCVSVSLFAKSLCRCSRRAAMVNTIDYRVEVQLLAALHG
eukprot:1684839-Rhodomonas_salina.1